MPEGHVLEFTRVTKRFGAVAAVSDFSARVEPGVVTGFLGPNGAGKTTTLRMLLGLVRADGGAATIGGRTYAQLTHPLQTVGAVLEASSFHPGRTAAAHLRVYARAASISNARVDEVLALVGLADAAGRKVGGFSLGMRQRLGVAYALLGDPGVLVLDEPSNGLDPEGIRWMRGFLRQLAREGRTVLVSSHLLTEIQQTVDALVIIAQGRLVFQGGLEELVDPAEYATVTDAPDRAALRAALANAEIPYEVLRSGITVRGFEPTVVGRAAADAGVPLSLLQRRGPALEEVFLELVSGARVHASASGSTTPAVPGPVFEPLAVTAAAAATIPEPDAATSEAAPDAETEAAEAVAPEAAAAGVDADAAAVATEADGTTDVAVAPLPEAEPESADPESDASAEAPEPTATDGETPADGSDVEASADAELEPAPDADAYPADGREDTASEFDDAAAASELDGEPAADADEDAPIPAGDDAAAASETDDTAEATDETGEFEPRAAFSVAATGIIDIVPLTASADAEPPADADPDVEQIGEIDDELSSPDEAPDDTPGDGEVTATDSDAPEGGDER